MKNAINRYSLAELQTFVVVADELSFVQAGRLLNLSASSVSRQVANLEEALGTKLFSRSTRKVVLTDAGDALYQEVAPVLYELFNLGDKLHGLSGKVQGGVTIATPRWYATHYLAPLLPLINQKYPDLQLEVLSSDQLQDPSFSPMDLFIRFNGVVQPDLIARQLMPFDYWLVASPDTLSSLPSITQPNDLPLNRLLAYRFSDPHNQWLFRQKGQLSRVSLNHATVASDNPEVLLQCALHNGGVTLLPDIGVKTWVDSGRLVRLLPDYEVTPNRFDNAVYLVYTREKAQLARVRAVIDVLLDGLAIPVDI